MLLHWLGTSDTGMNAYDPLIAPDPDEWQSLDDDERLLLVTEYHRQVGAELPNERIHAAIHVVIENQTVLGDAMPVQATLERLLDEGLDRHDAIHAIGSVLANFMHELLGAGDKAPSVNERYYEELEKLQAAEWREDSR